MTVTDSAAQTILAHSPGLHLSEEDINAVLTAAKTAGVIPTATSETQWGLDFRDCGGGVYETTSLQSAQELKAFEDSGVETVVTRTVTTYAQHATPWRPAPDNRGKAAS